jgi:TolA-binding protein
MNCKDLYESEGEISAGLAFLDEDLIGRAEKLITKVEAEKNSPQTPPPSNPNYQNNLGNEITDLKNQIKQLEDKNKDNSSPVKPVEKEVYQKLLEDIKKRLDDKEKEFQKIQKQDQKDKPNNNLPLIIGISAVAVCFLLIIIIVLLVRRRRD